MRIAEFLYLKFDFLYIISLIVFLHQTINVALGKGRRTSEKCDMY